MHYNRKSAVRKTAIIISFTLIISFLFPGVSAQTEQEAEVPRGSVPDIDGVVQTEEWNGSEVITLTVEGNQVDILFKHNGDSVYFGFDIQDGHNSVFPDTRVFFDLEHDAATSPQEDDYQLYINPDHQDGPFIERQGDGGDWEPVDIVHWTGDYHEDGTDHWTTEYNVSSEKFGDFTGNESFGFALLVWGNSPNANDTWPDNANIDDPSTWGDISFQNWTEDPDEGNEDPLTNNTPPGNNETDSNQTGNDNESAEDDDFLTIPELSAILGMGFAAIVIPMRRARKVR